jgi:endonuclease III
MHKTELLNELKEAIRTEETASAIYLTHIHAITERVGIKKNQTIEKIQSELNNMIKENNRHRRLLEEFIEMIDKEDRDDW